MRLRRDQEPANREVHPSLGGETVNKVPPADRGIAMVFQSYALYPHMTVFDNMAFGLKLAGLPKDKIKFKVDKAAELLQLTPYIDRLPRHLSGGQRQRVAIGRAITRDPKVFLFDEPLSNLDAALRVATRIEIANLKDSLPDATMIYVTHDQVEAMTLADRIVVFNAGKIEQIGTPLELYHHPENLFVARFIGSPAMNILPVELVEGSTSDVRVGQSRPIKVNSLISASNVGHIGIRPEHLYVAPDSDAILQATVVLVEELGEFAIIHADIGTDELIVSKLENSHALKKNDKVGLCFDIKNMHVFDREGLKAAR